MNEDERGPPGYPDVNKVDEDLYEVGIPIPGHHDKNRGVTHDGGTVTVWLTGSQLNEWANRFGEVANDPLEDAGNK